MARTKITRICPGEYEVSHGEYVVSISRMDHLDYEYGQWVVAANWDRSLYSDPIIYLSDAKKCAKQMINDEITEQLQRVTESNKKRLADLAEFRVTL